MLSDCHIARAISDGDGVNCSPELGRFTAVERETKLLCGIGSRISTHSGRCLYWPPLRKNGLHKNFYGGANTGSDQRLFCVDPLTRWSNTVLRVFTGSARDTLTRSRNVLLLSCRALNYTFSGSPTTVSSDFSSRQ
jgi:hypothetical protein